MHRSDEIENTDVVAPGVPLRVILAVRENLIMHKHDRVCNHEPDEGQVLGISMGEESVDPIHFDVAKLPVVLDFIARDPDG